MAGEKTMAVVSDAISVRTVEADSKRILELMKETEQYREYLKRNMSKAEYKRQSDSWYANYRDRNVSVVLYTGQSTGGSFESQVINECEAELAARGILYMTLYIAWFERPKGKYVVCSTFPPTLLKGGRVGKRNRWT